MGGFGSGRPSGSGRDTVEASRSLDVNRLHREGCLRAGWAGGWQWTHDGERVASISCAPMPTGCISPIVCASAAATGRTSAETVRIVRMPCRFGGARPYFVCPGVVNGIACGRRVVKLHGAGTLFPLPPLLSPRPCQPERKRMGSGAAAREQNQTAPRRRSRHGRAVPEEAQGHVAADL